MEDEKYDLNEEDDIEKLKEKFKSEATAVSLHMNRVPKHVKEDFTDLAAAEFADDYGMALTFLMRQKDLHSKVDAQIENLTARIRAIEEKQEMIWEMVKEDDEDEKSEQTDRLNA